jgi:hypothetical protein
MYIGGYAEELSVPGSFKNWRGLVFPHWMSNYVVIELSSS